MKKLFMIGAAFIAAALVSCAGVPSRPGAETPAAASFWPADYTSPNDAVFASKPSKISIDGMHNFRELGQYKTKDGKTVKSNKIYRSDQFANATPAGVDAMKALGIALVIDLRSSREAQAAPDADIGAESVNINMPYTAGGMPTWDGEADFYRRVAYPMMQSMGDFLYIGSRPRAGIGEVIRTVLAQEGKPILFHCSHGKDRTGYTAAIMLKILGVDNETILKDYLLSNVNREEQVTREAEEWQEKYFKGEPDEAALMDGFYQFHYVQPSYARYITEIDRLYGDVDTFLTIEAGLTKAELDAFRAYYLE